MTATSDDTIAEPKADVSALRAKLDASLAQRRSDLDERTAYQSATIDVLKAMSASPGDPTPVFDLIVRQASALCGSANALLFEYDGSMIDCRFIVSSHLTPEQIEIYLRQYPLPLERDPDHSAAVAIRERRVVHVRDSDAETGVSAAARGNGIRSAITVPLIRSGVVAGALTLADTRPGGHTDSQIELLQTFAEQAVIAISSAETYRALRDRTHELTARDAENQGLTSRQAASIDVLRAISASPDDAQPVLELIVRRAVELVNAQLCNLVEYDGTLMHQRAYLGGDPQAMARLVATFPCPPGMETMPGRAILTGQIVHVPDAQADHGIFLPGRGLGTQAFLAVPLKRDERVIGALGFGRFDPGEFDQSAIELVQSFADNWLWVFPGTQMCLRAAEILGFLPGPPNWVRSSFLEGQNGWNPTWASDSHAIGAGAV
jgi:two-component system, NtrC family, sensor kinase